MKKLLIIAILLSITLAPLGAGVAVAQQPNTGNAPATSGEVTGGCGIFSGWLDCFTSFFAIVGQLVLTLVSKVLDIAGAVLNFSVETTVNMGDFLSKVKIVDVGWKVFRDIANLFFIFVLLWIGIRTILGLGGGEIKKLLLNVIIMAMLINFSLFITKAIVDAGNVATLHFYNAMRPDLYEVDNVGNKTPVLDKSGKQVKAGLSDIYMEALKIQSLMGDPSTVANTVASAGGFANQFIKIGISTILGSVFFLVAAFIFFAAAVLFLIRAVVLMLLMLLSPLAFVAQILPSSEAQSLAKKWWDTLFKQTFFAPLYMALTYAVAKAIQSGGFGKVLNIEGNTASFAAVLASDASDNIGIVVNYIILIILMVATLIIANSMAGSGGKMVMGWGQKLKGWGMGKVKGAAYGATIGATGGMFSRIAGAHGKAVEEKYRGSTSTFGRAAMRYAERLQTSKFGGATSAKERQEKGTFFRIGEKESEEALKEMRGKPEEQARYMSKLSPRLQEKMYEKLSARDRAAVETEGLKSKVLTPEIITALKDKLSVEEREKTEKEIKKSSKEGAEDALEGAADAIAKALKEALAAGQPNPLVAGVTHDGVIYKLSPTPGAENEKGIKETVDQITDKNITKYNPETLKTIAPFLKKSHWKTIGEEKENLTPAERKELINERMKPLIIAAGGGVMGVPLDPARIDPASVTALMKEYDADEVARFSNDLKVLPEIMKNYRRDHLAAMVKQGLSYETASTIRDAIIKTGTAKNVIDWLRTSPAAQDVFGT